MALRNIRGGCTNGENRLCLFLQEISGGASSTVVTSASDFVWRGMRTVAEIRREKNQAIPVNKDSLYKPVERAPRVFNPLRVSAFAVAVALAFAFTFARGAHLCRSTGTRNVRPVLGCMRGVRDMSTTM